MQFKEFFIWTFSDQIMFPGWVKNGKKAPTTTLTTSPVFPKNKVLNTHNFLTL